MLKCFNWHFGTKLISINKKLLPLSPIYISVLQEIKKWTKWELYLTRSCHRMCLEALWLWWGQCHALRNHGFVCASASPWAIKSFRCERHWNALAQSVFFGWHSEAASKWGWNIYERESWKGRKPRNVLFTAHVLYYLFLGNSFEFCSSVGWSGSEVTPLKQPVYSRFTQLCWMAGSASEHFILAVSQRVLYA